MDIKSKIESLFDAVDEPVETPVKSELEKLTPGIEKREFTRAEVLDKKIGVRFNNQLQFARQYIENISLGGIFVKTTDKFQMGQIITMEFKVPHPQQMGEEINFQLKAKVCRITDQGVGLEFTNLDQENRILLEGFVRSVLPSGIDIRAKPKQASIDRVEQLREARKASSQARRRIRLQLLFIISLLIANGFLFHENIKELQSRISYDNSRIRIGNESIDLRKIRRLKKTKDGSLVIEHSEGQVEITDPSWTKDLPQHLRHNFDLIQSIQPTKEKRRSKNAPRHINTR